MRPLALLAVSALLCAGPRALAEDRPTRAALRFAFESNQRSVVRVKGPRGEGLGVIVGASGQVLTSVEWISLERATVTVGGQEQPGKVVMANAQLKVALVSLTGDDFPAAPARPDGALAKGTWLVGVVRPPKAGALEAKVGQVKKPATERSPFVETDLLLQPGSPVFDGKGRLVGIGVEARKDGSRLLPLPAVKAQLAAEAKR